MEASLDATRGEFDLSVGPSERLRIDGTSVTGAVRTEFDYVQAHVAARFDFRVREEFGVALFVGPVYSNVGIRLSQGALNNRADRERIGGIAGAELRWQPSEDFTPYIRGSYGFLSVSGTTGSIESGLRVHFENHLTMFVAGRYLRYRYDDFWGARNDVDLRATGVLFGLSWDF